jgi:hypothetical protein
MDFSAPAPASTADHLLTAGGELAEDAAHFVGYQPDAAALYSSFLHPPNVTDYQCEFCVVCDFGRFGVG